MPVYTCQICSCLREHVSMRQAARITMRNRKTIKLWVEKVLVSFKEFPSGRVMICSQCLIRSHRPQAMLAAASM